MREPLQARSTKCRGRRSRYGKTCSFCMYSYITVCIIPNVLIPGTSLWASTTRTTSSTSIQQQYIHDVVHRAFYFCFFSTTATVTTAVVAVVLTLTHRYNAVRGHRTGSNNSYSSSSVQYARNIMRLFLDETHARGAQVRYVTTYVFIRLAFWRGECLYQRPSGIWLF